MNRSAEILEYLSKAKSSETLIIAPMAPPVDRTSTGLEVALTKVLDTADVADTLASLYTRATGADAYSLPESGTFSFGLKDVGRFRVHYMTQRGSKVISIVRIPVTLPELSDFCGNPDLAQVLTDIVKNNSGGGLCVFGPSSLRNSTLTYSLLSSINRTSRRLIYCLERSLTFLMNHDNSIIIQSELHIDVPSLDEGIERGLALSPDILFLGDLRTAEDLASAARVLDTGVFTIFTTVAATPHILLSRLRHIDPGAFSSVQHLLTGVVGVISCGTDPVSLEYIENSDFFSNDEETPSGR